MTDQPSTPEVGKEERLRGSGIWFCKIGQADWDKLPKGSDYPMRQAVAACFRELTGEIPDYIFSGWNGALTEPELAVVEDRAGKEERFSVEMSRGQWLVVLGAAANYESRVPREQGDGGECLQIIADALGVEVPEQNP